MCVLRIILKICVSFCALFYGFNTSYGQVNKKIDSLIRIAGDAKQDTNKVKILLKISKEYLSSDPLKAIDYSNQAYDLASKIDYTTGSIDSTWYHINDNYYTQYKLQEERGRKDLCDSALILAQKSLQMIDLIKDEKVRASVFTSQAIIFQRENEPFPARKYFKKAFDLYHQITDSVGYSNLLYGLGHFYKEQEQYDSAAFCFKEFIKICEMLDNKEGQCKGYYNLGDSYWELEDFDNAKYYYRASITFNVQSIDQIGYNYTLVSAYRNLALIAQIEKSFDDIIDYFLEQSKKSINLTGLAEVNYLLGEMYELTNDNNLALLYFIEAINLFKGIDDDTLRFIRPYGGLARIYAREKNFDQAIIIYDSILLLSGSTKSLIDLDEILSNLQNIYEQKYDLKNAYKILMRRDSLLWYYTNNKNWEIYEQLENKYKKKIDQTRVLTLENENLKLIKDIALKKRTGQRNTYLFSGLSLVLLISFSFINYRNKTVKDRIISEQKIQQLEDEKKMLAARAIVEGQEEERKRVAKELHDGLGVLLATAKMQFSSIKDKNPENKPLIENAAKLLEQATGDVRRISHNMMPGLLTKFGFYEAVEDLFDQINDAEGPKAEIKIEGETTRLPENIEIMLYRIVQEMVNNTLKHADAHKVSLTIKALQDQLNIKFSDDGKGFDVPEKMDSKTIGLTSISSRVKFLNGTANVESKPGEGCTYFIQIPKTNI